MSTLEVVRSPQFLPPEALKAKISVSLTKQFGNYQQAVDMLRNMAVDRNNLKDAQQVLRNVNSMLSFTEDCRKEDKEPFLAQGRTVDQAYKDFIAPIEQSKSMLQQKVNIVAKELEEEERQRQLAEHKRSAIRDAINTFTTDYSIKIASATNNEQLSGYERLINLEKGKKTLYADQLPGLIERCNQLNGMIKEQKELIRRKERIEAEKKKADDAELEQLLQKQQEIDAKIEENTILVQENAANALILNVQMSDTTENGVKARRTVWKAELVNVKEAIKRSLDMLDVSLNGERVRETINTLKAAGTFKGKSEVTINGIRYYEEKTF